MKKTLFSLVLLATSTLAMAQTTNPNQLCQQIASVSSSNGPICAGIISRNYFEPSAIKLASVVLRHGSSHAIEVLNVTANKRVDPRAMSVCERVAGVSGTNTAVCARTVDEFPVSNELEGIANAVLAHGSSHVIATLQAGLNVYLFPPAADVCKDVAAVSGSNTAVCVQTIANKVSMNGAEQICKTSLRNGSSSAIECLRNVMMDYYSPIPQPQPEPARTVMVEVEALRALKRELAKTKNQLERGRLDAAKLNLDDASRLVDELLAR